MEADGIGLMDKDFATSPAAITTLTNFVWQT